MNDAMNKDAINKNNNRNSLVTELFSRTTGLERGLVTVTLIFGQFFKENMSKGKVVHHVQIKKNYT